tara:strand:- start:175 stop:369 length:195 start_codon:yes stop_codon:yes gene_type:complete
MDYEQQRIEQIKTQANERRARFEKSTLGKIFMATMIGRGVASIFVPTGEKAVDHYLDFIDGRAP